MRMLFSLALGHRGTQVRFNETKGTERSLAGCVCCSGITKISDAKTQTSDSEDLCASDRSPAGWKKKGPKSGAAMAAPAAAAPSPLPCDIISSLSSRFHSVLIAFLLLRNRETVLVVNNAGAHTAAIFNCC